MMASLVRALQLWGGRGTDAAFATCYRSVLCLSGRGENLQLQKLEKQHFAISGLASGIAVVRGQGDQ